MTATLVPQARTALSPEWEHGFDEEFTDLVTGDPDLVQTEFDALIDACWNVPPQEPGPPGSRSCSPSAEPPTVPAARAGDDDANGDPIEGRRPPP